MFLENLRRRMDVYSHVVIAALIYDRFSSSDKNIASRLVRKFLSGDFTELSAHSRQLPQRIKIPPTDSLTYAAVVTELKKKGYDIQ